MSGYNDSDTGFERFDYYKKLLVNELKNSSHDDASDALDDIEKISDKVDAYEDEEIKDSTFTSRVNKITQRLYEYKSVKSVSKDILTPFQNAVANLVMDGDKNLYIYSSHAYNISNVQLVDKKGNLLNGSNFEKVFEKISPKKSTVTMQNPWGSDTPNIQGNDKKNGEGDYGVDHGTFTTPLGEYLASVHTVSYAEIDR